MNILLASTSETVSFLGGWVFVLALLLVGVAILVFEIWMIIDALSNPALDSTSRTLWIIGMLLLHPIVAIIYFFTTRKQPPAPAT